MVVEGTSSLWALCAFALESFVQRRTEDFPELLFCFTVQGHRLRLHLPALLQSFDGVHAQSRGSTHLLGLLNQSLATVDAGLLSSFKAGGCGFENAFPLALHFAKGFLAQVTRIAPTVSELVQRSQLGAPILRLGLGRSPGLDLFHQGDALCTLVGRVFFHLLKPSQHSLVSLVACGIESLPQSMVGQTALVNLLPAVTQLTQLVLHLAPAHSRGFVFVQQSFGLRDQVKAHLIGQPTLPTFGIACGREGLVQTLVQTGVQIFTVRFERGAQSGASFGQGRALDFGDLLFEALQSRGDRLQRLLAQGLALGRVDFGFGWLVGFVRLFGTGHSCAGHGACGGVHHFAALTANLVGPDRHRGQSRAGVAQGLIGQGQGSRKTIPNRLHLFARSIQLVGVFEVNTRPNGADSERLGLGLPLRDIVLQTGVAMLGLSDRFGRQHLNALGQQDRRFALHHDLVLQILNALDHVDQLDLQAGQRLAREGSARLGGVALPSQCIGHVQAWSRQNQLGFLRPIAGQCLLPVAALDLIDLFFELFGHPFVLGGQLAVDLMQCGFTGPGLEPFAQTGAAIT